jgi:myo-inositol-1(or 4)-monophosphatase
MKFSKEYKKAEKIIKDAGSYLLKNNNKGVISSVGKDTKAIADIEIEKFIINSIQSFSDYPILSEESYQDFFDNNGKYWIVDPIDGTLNYTRSIPLSCISIAFWDGSKPIFGLIYDFNQKELIKGYVGNGAWLNNKLLGSPPLVNQDQSILATGFSTYIDLDNDKVSLESFIKSIMNYKKIRLLGSAALSIAYVGLNRVNAYFEKDIKLWDIAGGIAILHSLKIPYEMKSTGDYCYDVFAYNHKKQN